jgi:hypothetical protein
LKGEERVCHVTEADRLGPQGLSVSEKCLHVRPLGVGFCPCARRFCAAERKFRRGSSASKGIWWMPWH